MGILWLWARGNDGENVDLEHNLVERTGEKRPLILEPIQRDENILFKLEGRVIFSKFNGLLEIGFSCWFQWLRQRNFGSTKIKNHFIVEGLRASKVRK